MNVVIISEVRRFAMDNDANECSVLDLDRQLCLIIKTRQSN